MYIVDSHCDSIERLDRPLVNKHNFSIKYPQLQFVAMFACHPGEDVQTCFGRTQRYLEHFDRSLKNEHAKIEKVTDFCEIAAAFSRGKHAALLTVEGGSGIAGSIDNFTELYRRGVRVFGLAWLHNDLAKSNRLQEGECDTGLTSLGKSVIQKGNELGMIFDVSHLSDNSFWDVAALSKKPIVATHSNFRAVCDHSRNLTDDMAREIVRRDGMIGLNLYPDFIDGERATVDRLFAHIDYALELGCQDHLGFGFDIDGTDGLYPISISEDSSIHDQIVDKMLTRYPHSLIEKIAYKNYMEFLEKYL